MAKRWQQSEISYLQRYGKGKPLEELAKRFKTDARTVKAKLAELAPPAKAGAKPATRAGARPAARPAVKTAAKPAVKPVSRPVSKPAPKPVSKPAARPKPKLTVKPAAKPEPKPAKPQPKPQPKPTTKPEPRPTTKPAAMTATKPPSRKTAAPSPSPQPEPADPALTAYTEALKAMHKQDWPRAVKLFDKLATDEDRPEIAARARQYLAAARQRLDGEAGQAEPAGHEDAYLKAVLEKNRGNLVAALEICRRGGRDKKDERFAYLVASIHALDSRTEDAAQALTQAIELNPKNRIHAFHDADFAELRKDRDFRHLFDLP